uniref:hypothetical protein n=1 Tax=Bacteroides pyogenes TaxID=310300 RepID=UPI002FDAA955
FSIIWEFRSQPILKEDTAGIKQKLAKKELQVPPRQSTAAKQRKRTARHTQTLFWKRNLQNSVSKV